MLGIFDCETRGLFGKIFRIGFLLKNKYYTFYTGNEFIKFITTKVNEIEEELKIFAFNLDFDFVKILAEDIEINKENFKLVIDYNKSLIISNAFTIVKLKNYNITFHDIYPLVGCSLDQASKSFNLKTKKIKLNQEDLNEYFLNVDADDEELNQYLKSDVYATKDLIEKVRELSGLEIEDFAKCPTTAALSMRIFKTKYKEDFQTITNSKLSFEQEEFVRESYFGGRAEVFKTHIDEGYHYDINSLYPSVMEKNYYPVGIMVNSSSIDLKHNKETFNALLDSGYMFIADIAIEIPSKINIPPLPYYDKKLLFPCGIIRGTWTCVEIKYALSLGCKIIDVYCYGYWKNKEKVFKKFVGEQKHIKINSSGAKKQFAKLVQNSLYGKFGMNREREVVYNYDDKTIKKLEKTNKVFALVKMQNEKLIITHKTFYSDYIRPHYSTYIASYARIELLKEMHNVESRGGKIFYCDTDSIVSDIKLEKNKIDANEYGKWKLERRIGKGIFVLPKLYAEVNKETNEEILKSKGLIKKFRQTLNFNSYHEFLENMIIKKDMILYTEDDAYKGRRKGLITIKNESDNFDKEVILKKKFAFGRIELKRKFDFKKNKSEPLYVVQERVL